MKKIKVLEALLGVAGIEENQISLSEALFSPIETEFADGKVTKFDVTDQHREVLKTVLKQSEGQEDKGKQKEPDKGAGAGGEENLDDKISKAVTAALKAAGVGESKAAVAKAPGGTKPPEGSGSSGSGITREAITKMSQDDINDNWDAIKVAIKDGSLNKAA